MKFSSEIVRLNCKSDKGEDAVKSLQEITEVLPSSAKTQGPDSDIWVPECLNHVLEQKFCNFCKENAIFILNLVPVIVETYIVLNKEKTAVTFLEDIEKFITHKLGPKDNNSKNFLPIKKFIDKRGFTNI